MSLRLNVDEAAVVVGGLAVPKQRYLPTSPRYLRYLWRLLEVSVLRRRSPDKVRLEALAETEPGTIYIRSESEVPYKSKGLYIIYSIDLSLK